MTLTAQCPGCEGARRTIIVDDREVLIRKLENGEEVRGLGFACGHEIVFGADSKATMKNALASGMLR